MLIGVIASTLARGVAPDGGLRTAQYAGVPQKPSDPATEAGVISRKSRSAPVQDAIADCLRAPGRLQKPGCEQVIFGYCSTFDLLDAGSSPATHMGHSGGVKWKARRLPFSGATAPPYVRPAQAGPSREAANRGPGRGGLPDRRLKSGEDMKLT